MCHVFQHQHNINNKHNQKITSAAHPIFFAMLSHVAVALFETLLTELEAAVCTDLKPSDVLVAAADACTISRHEERPAGADVRQSCAEDSAEFLVAHMQTSRGLVAAADAKV
jgi:hypothetical protein